MKVELTGIRDSTIRLSFKDLEDEGYPSVTDYCRDLVKNFGYQEGTIDNCKIEVYRGEMLCLTVTDIRKAATIQPDDNGWRKVHKHTLQRLERAS